MSKSKSGAQTKTSYREADKGHYVTEQYAKAHPKTTVKETTKILPKDKK